MTTYTRKYGIYADLSLKIKFIDVWNVTKFSYIKKDHTKFIINIGIKSSNLNFHWKLNTLK